MGNNHSEHSEPLKPIVYYNKPLWAPRYTDKDGNPIFYVKSLIDYNDQCVRTGKRKSFWTELSLRLPQVDDGIYITHAPRTKEDDRAIYDPPVPDGTSLVGALGLDTKFTRDMAIKESFPEKIEDYRENLYRASQQYKQIAGKFDLSPEHPGMKVAPNLLQISHTDYPDLGARWGHFHRFWPRFFDKPLNEGCLEKGLAAAKYAALIGVIRTNVEMRRIPRLWPEIYAFQLRPLLRYYIGLNKNFIALSFIWGSSLCFVADFRKRDDVYNHCVVAPLTALCYYELSGRNAMRSTVIGVALLGTGILWHYLRASPEGFFSQECNASTNDLRFGPQAWKWFDQGKIGYKKYDY